MDGHTQSHRRDQTGVTSLITLATLLHIKNVALILVWCVLLFNLFLLVEI